MQAATWELHNTREPQMVSPVLMSVLPQGVELACAISSPLPPSQQAGLLRCSHPTRGACLSSALRLSIRKYSSEPRVATGRYTSRALPIDTSVVRASLTFSSMSCMHTRARQMQRHVPCDPPDTISGNEPCVRNRGKHCRHLSVPLPVTSPPMSQPSK